MRRASRRLVPLALALLPIALAAGPSAAAPSEADSAYRAWRIPEHRWWSSGARLSGNASHRDNTHAGGFRGRSGSFGGNLNLDVAWGYDSDPAYLTTYVVGRLFGSRSHDEARLVDAFQDATSENGFETLDESVAAALAWRRYPWAPPFGFSLSTAQAFSLAQRFNSAEGTRVQSVQTQRTVASSASGDWTWEGSASAGVGFGRVRDATPVYQAQVLEERLRRTGALSRALTREARVRVAALLATRGGVSFAHGRPTKYFWEALEQVLRDDGALERGSLDAYSTHRILEPVVSTGNVIRRIGYFVGPSVVVSTRQLHQSREESLSNLLYLNGTLVSSSEFRGDFERTDRQDRVSTAFGAEVHRPLGLRWQLDASSVTRIGESGSFVDINTLASAAWLVSDRWVGGVGAQHAAFATGHDSDRRIRAWDVSLGANLHYFLEDAWALSLSMSETQRHSSTSFFRDGNYSFGITRVLGGYFDLAGITVMRAAPPTR